MSYDRLSYDVEKGKAVNNDKENFFKSSHGKKGQNYP